MLATIATLTRRELMKTNRSSWMAFLGAMFSLRVRLVHGTAAMAPGVARHHLHQGNGKTVRRLMKLGFVVAVIVVAGQVTGCSQAQEKQADQQNDVEQALARLPGTYLWRADLNAYSYSAKTQLESILSAIPPERAVTLLIDCLDATSTSASVLDGKPVATGIICYEGLTQIAYHEPTDAHGDVAADWTGFISSKASPKDMRSAKAAWKRALGAKLLIFQ